MKKVILVLMIIFLPLQTSAKEMKTPKLFVDVDRTCAPLTYVDNTITSIYECLRKELTNPYNYAPGWSKNVIADIQLKPVGEAIERYPIRETTKQSEEVAKKIAIPILDKIYGKFLDELKKQPDVATTVIPASKLKELRY